MKKVVSKVSIEIKHLGNDSASTQCASKRHVELLSGILASEGDDCQFTICHRCTGDESCRWAMRPFQKGHRDGKISSGEPQVIAPTGSHFSWGIWIPTAPIALAKLLSVLPSLPGCSDRNEVTFKTWPSTTTSAEVPQEIQKIQRKSMEIVIFPRKPIPS